MRLFVVISLLNITIIFYSQSEIAWKATNTPVVSENSEETVEGVEISYFFNEHNLLCVTITNNSKVDWDIRVYGEIIHGDSIDNCIFNCYIPAESKKQITEVDMDEIGSYEDALDILASGTLNTTNLKERAKGARFQIEDIRFRDSNIFDGNGW